MGKEEKEVSWVFHGGNIKIWEGMDITIVSRIMARGGEWSQCRENLASDAESGTKIINIFCCSWFGNKMNLEPQKISSIEDSSFWCKFKAQTHVSKSICYSGIMLSVSAKKVLNIGTRLVMERCQLGVTCDSSGHKIPNYDQALSRQTGELFSSDASPDCRVELAPDGCKWSSHFFTKWN